MSVLVGSDRASDALDDLLHPLVAQSDDLGNRPSRQAGMRTVWFCEQDEFCQRVLAKHWPGVPCYPDIRELTGDSLRPVDVLCGGFPCQDLSVAGNRAGLNGARSGLWFEYLRLIGELRPSYVIVENVPQLRKYLGMVTGGLAEIGYDAEWDCISARDFGAPHLRRRLWLVAYPGGARRRQDAGSAHGDEAAHEGWRAEHDHVADGDGEGDRARDVADASSNGRGSRRPRRSDPGGARQPKPNGALQVADAYGEPEIGSPVAWAERNPWPTEPDLPRMAHGIPNGLDRRRALGNALVPQIAEWIGHRVMAYEQTLEIAA